MNPDTSVVPEQDVEPENPHEWARQDLNNNLWPPVGLHQNTQG